MINKKITKYAKRQEKKSEETKQPSESDMTRVLESSDREFKITMIDIWRALVVNVDSMQEQRGNTSREIKIYMSQKKMLEVKDSNKWRVLSMGLLAKLT